MKLLLLFNEFFLYLNAFHRSLSYVCFIRRGIFNFAAVFILPWLFCFAVRFLFCHGCFVLPWLFHFCLDFFVLPWLFCFAVTFLFCRDVFVLPWFFLFCHDSLVLPSLFGFAVTPMGHRIILYSLLSLNFVTYTKPGFRVLL